MQQTSTQVLTIIIAIVLILVIIGVFMLVILSYYNNRKISSIREKELLKREFQQSLLKTQLEVQEQTMRQISQEIHDNVGQILSLVNLNLRTVKAADPEKINTTTALVNKAIEDLRNLSKSLNPESIAKVGLVQLLKNELDQLEKTGQFSIGMSVDGYLSVAPDRLLILYRMVQEVLNNIIKHSEATEVNARITDSGIIITDNGNGFDDQNCSNGLGLQNLKQRAKVIGADVNINSTSGKGTIVTFKLNNTE